ncbi:MAG: hypothetical protein NT087_08650 [Deltaproteobacteria bacterium]|nr:hypothetical protein [Deltaproteobacteria bacterium]
MKSRVITSVAVVAIVAALCVGEVFAAGRGNGGAANRGTGTSSATRPADSQRRDGTFSTTGTTANGSTTRPSNGRGLQDGSRLNTTTAQ